MASLALALMVGTLPQVQSDDHFSHCQGGGAGPHLALQRIESEWPIRGSGDPVSQFVQKLGMRLARLSATGGNAPWQFLVVRNLAPNAFSIGGGHVFVTDGAVNFAQNESELAAILAHELGHELAGHFCLSSRSLVSKSPFDFFSDPTTPPDQVGVGSMKLEIDPAKEQQADQIAITILQASGFDPRAMLLVARRLPKASVLHPADSRRLEALGALLASTPSRIVQNSSDFSEIKRVLAEEGLVK